jgi:RNA polymerase sigma factor (sigma-70 family)
MSPKQIANLIDAHSPALLLYARQFGACAEDLVQEAFARLTAQRTWPNEVVPWLYRVVRNAALDVRKKHQRRMQREQEVARATCWFVEPEMDGLDAETSVSALQELPIEQREVIVARLWGGLTFEQIGEIVGSSSSTTFRRYQAGIAALQNRLGMPCANQTN